LGAHHTVYDGQEEKAAMEDAALAQTLGRLAERDTGNKIGDDTDAQVVKATAQTMLPNSSLSHFTFC